MATDELSAPRSRGNPINDNCDVCVSLHVPNDQRQYLPERMHAPMPLPSNAHLPRQGDVIYLSSTSAWCVSMVIHEWMHGCEPRVAVWLEHVGGAHASPVTFGTLMQ